jgi:hypothetical protein
MMGIRPQLIVAAIPPRMPSAAEPKPAPPTAALSATSAAPPPAVRLPLVAFQAEPRGVLGTGTSGRLPSLPVPSDPQEPVAGGVQIASEPAARAAALSLVERARENGLNHRPGTPHTVWLPPSTPAARHLMSARASSPKRGFPARSGVGPQQ